MTPFARVRIATLLWGFIVSLVFTGKLGLASAMFLTMAAGNTIIMWVILRKYGGM